MNVELISVVENEMRKSKDIIDWNSNREKCISYIYSQLDNSVMISVRNFSTNNPIKNKQIFKIGQADSFISSVIDSSGLIKSILKR